MTTDNEAKKKNTCSANAQGVTKSLRNGSREILQVKP